MHEYIIWLWRSAEGVRGKMAVQTLVGSVHIAISLFYVWTCKQLVDIATQRAEGSLFVNIALMAGCIGLQILLSALVSRLEIESEIDMKNRLRYRLFSHIMDCRWSGSGKMHTGDVMNRLLADVDAIATHNELVNTVIHNLFDEDIDTVIGLRAVAKFADIHTGTTTNVFTRAKRDNIVVRVVVDLYLLLTHILNFLSSLLSSFRQPNYSRPLPLCV